MQEMQPTPLGKSVYHGPKEPIARSFTSFTDINGRGQISAFGKNSLGETHSFLLTPTHAPEPEIYAMMLAGLGLLGFMVRRKKQKSH